MIIIRHFLVDSENVNDNWLMLFDMADEDDEIIVFYTKKSPHMSYMSVIRLMENNSINVRFEECYEGTNALDFQLVSYMGYLMGRNDTHSENKTTYFYIVRAVLSLKFETIYRIERYVCNPISLLIIIHGDAIGLL